MPAFTLRYRAVPEPTEIARVEKLVAGHNGTIAWQKNPSFERTYALVEGVDTAFLPEMGPAIIALAVCPSVAEALPRVEEALGGPGRPAGIRSCERVGNAIVAEWDLNVTSARTVLNLCDIELARFHSGRVNTLLTPLSDASWAKIASEGLNAPEIAPNRVLEVLIQEHHVPH